MKPIGPLMREHRLIEQMLKVVNKRLSDIESGKKLDFCVVQKMGDFFHTYADRAHHGKEEEILFRALADRKMTDEHRNMMDGLIEEHREARQKVGRLRQAAADGKSRRAVAECFSELLVLYPRHIEKEDKHFFYPILEYFSSAELESMLEEFREFDRQMIHEKYQKLVEELG